jgi:hypothetical protein
MNENKKLFTDGCSSLSSLITETLISSLTTFQTGVNPLSRRCAAVEFKRGKTNAVEFYHQSVCLKCHKRLISLIVTIDWEEVVGL